MMADWPEIRATGDGSPTLFSPVFHATYHSVHGALQESLHVFIRAGLHFVTARFPGKPLKIMEAGLGTGLNAWLTALDASENRIPVQYLGIELYPIPITLLDALRYADAHRPEEHDLYLAIHHGAWEEPLPLTPFFTLTKNAVDVGKASLPGDVDLVYYDAFGPETQPELWDESALARMAGTLAPGGCLVTYCAKGEVRRILRRLGLIVERLPGPPGKREMLRACKDP